MGRATPLLGNRFECWSLIESNFQMPPQARHLQMRLRAWFLSLYCHKATEFHNPAAWAHANQSTLRRHSRSDTWSFTRKHQAQTQPPQKNCKRRVLGRICSSTKSLKTIFVERLSLFSMGVLGRKLGAKKTPLCFRG